MGIDFQELAGWLEPTLAGRPRFATDSWALTVAVDNAAFSFEENIDTPHVSSQLPMTSDDPRSITILTIKDLVGSI